VDDREGLEAEHVHLEHADLLERAHLELGDDGLLAVGGWPAPLVGAVQTGTYSESGPGAITTAGRVHRGVAGNALDPGAQVHQALIDRRSFTRSRARPPSSSASGMVRL
jgi:hypothetical protein